MNEIFSSIDTPDELRLRLLEADEILVTADGLLILRVIDGNNYWFDVGPGAWVVEQP